MFRTTTYAESSQRGLLLTSSAWERLRALRKKLKVHRRMVREAIGSALPKPRKRTERPRWKLASAAAFVDGILEADRKAPRKQRHTAHRIWERIRIEFPECQVCERTVRLYVRKRKIALGLVVHETFVPQNYDWGADAQIDWYEAYADIAGERTKLQVFAMRSMASGAAFHCAFGHATQQAFLEAHELAFRFFGEVFRKLRYDNLRFQDCPQFTQKRSILEYSVLDLVKCR